MSQVDVKNDSDSELIRRYEIGRDTTAFAEIVRRHGPMVMKVSRRMLGNVHDAEEAFQSTFLAVATASKQLRDKSCFAGWLHSIVRNSAKEIQRSRMLQESRTKKMIDKLDRSSQADSGGDAMDPAVSVANKELERVVDEELAQLSSKLKRALVLCDLEGLTHSQAAKQLGLPASTISSQVTSGRRKLRERLIQRGVSPPAIGIAGYLAMERKATAALAPEAIEMTTNQATLFAAGRTAEEIGVSTRVVQTASNVISRMAKAKLATNLLTAVLLIGSLTVTGIGISIATAGTVVLDDFDDGAYADLWKILPTSPGSLDASSGDLIVGRDETSIVGNDVVADSIGINLYNISARTQLKVTETGGSSNIAVRGQADGEAYGIGVGYLPDLGGSLIYFYRSDDLHDQTFFSGVVNLPYDVRQEDTIVQIDVIENELRGWHWRPGDPAPDEPQFVEFDDTYDTPGSIRLISSNRGMLNAPGTSKSIFRYVHVSDEHIPLSLPGDVNSDGTLSVADVDAVSTGLQSNDLRFDLNLDGELDVNDLAVWVVDHAKTFFGDSNFDGEFNSVDFVKVFQAGRFESGHPAGWSDGDWNGDGFFDSSDFVTAFQAGGYEMGPRVALARVPEPNVGFATILFSLFVTRRRSRR